MTGKRFIGGSAGVYDKYKENRWLWSEWEEVTEIMNNLDIKARERSKALSKLQKENDQLKQYKQAVSDVLKNWSQKNLSAKQLQVVIAIMEELNVMGELE